MDNDDYNEEVADHFVIEITPEFKELALKHRKRLKELQAEDNMIYEITSWNNLPKFIKMDVFGERTDYEYEAQMEKAKTEHVQITDEVFNEMLGDDIERPVVDVVLMHVKDDGVRWTGVYKYSNTEFFTGTIPFSLIESL